VFNRLKKAGVAALAASFLGAGIVLAAAPAQAAAPTTCLFLPEGCPPPIYDTPTYGPVRGKLPGGKG
jgi:hypothetical protein